MYTQLYSLAETLQLPPPPAFGFIYEGAIGQPTQTTSLATPWVNGLNGRRWERHGLAGGRIGVMG